MTGIESKGDIEVGWNVQGYIHFQCILNCCLWQD